MTKIYFFSYFSRDQLCFTRIFRLKEKKDNPLSHKIIKRSSVNSLLIRLKEAEKDLSICVGPCPVQKIEVGFEN